MSILSVDIGTTALKMGVYSIQDEALELVGSFSESYPINTYNDGLFSDIEPDRWFSAFRNGCKVLAERIAGVRVIALSGTTPGLTAIGRDGEWLYPAILMLDQRSRVQARAIIDAIGLEYLFRQTGNMPVAGGCSLASILWLRDEHPDLFDKTHKFGHSNTVFGHWLTGHFCIDPSSASLTALYNTVANDLTWNEQIASEFELPLEKLPDLVPTSESVGIVKAALAKELGFAYCPDVVIGGNDAVLAAYSAGIQRPGDVINVNGTCEISLVCLDKCIPSRNYNVRAHVVPDRWLTLHVMNAGGKAIEWFKSLFCSEMLDDEFFDHFVPKSLGKWINESFTVEYAPYLMGSRYSLDPMTASFSGITADTTRGQLFAALIRGLCRYQKGHLDEVASFLHLSKTIHLTGGALNESLIAAKKKWMMPCEYDVVEQSSMIGAAQLGRLYLERNG